MSKIYSRKGIRIPKINFKKINNNNFSNKNNKKIIKMILIIIIAIITFVRIVNAVGPVFRTICEVEAKSMATLISNEKATEVMSRYKYEDLITIHRDKENNINMIEANVITINEIISDVAIKIEKELKNADRNKISIALGTFTGSKIFAGRGPKVKIVISPVGNVETEYKSEFKSVGINQTLHRIYLQVDCKVNILTPFENVEREIKNQVILAENVIVGNIPSTYYNLEGLNKQDALEVIE